MYIIIKDDKDTNKVLSDFRKNNPTQTDKECAEYVARKVKEMQNERLRDRR